MDQSWLSYALIIVTIVAAIWFATTAWFRPFLREPFGLAVPIFTLGMFLLVPQMGDMLVGMKSGYGSSGPQLQLGQLGLGAGVLLLGLQAWFWTRAGLNARRGRYDDDPGPPASPYEAWAPRLTIIPSALIGFSPVFLAVDKTISCSDVPWVGVISAVAAWPIFWWAVLYRRKRIRKNGVVRPLPIRPHAALWMLAEAAPWGPWAALAMFALSLALLGLPEVFPRWINHWIRSPTAGLFALSAVIGPCFVLYHLFRQLLGYPLHWLGVRCPRLVGPSTADVFALAALLVLPLLGSQIFYSSYKVPSKAESRVQLDKRLDVADAVKRFTECRKSDDLAVTADGKIPAIIVAAEGGASRSAAWTLSAMRWIDLYTKGRFGADLFAIVGVSGGSLAAVTYDLAQAKYVQGNKPARTADDQVKFWDQDEVERGLVDVARSDILPSTIMRLFGIDGLFGLPTRAASLSAAFEDTWNDPAGFNLGDGLSKAGFLSLVQGHPCLPQLVLNGTDAQHGDRILTSTIDYGAYRPPPPVSSKDPHDPQAQWPPDPQAQIFQSSTDALIVIGGDIDPSVAVLNSARFPLVSPSGRLDLRVTIDPNPKLDPNPKHKSSAENYTISLDVVDGGVFENYGIQTAMELATAINRVQPAGGPQLQPIIVLISNDLTDADTDDVYKAEPSGRCRPIDERLNVAVIASAVQLQQPNRAGARVPEVATSVLGLIQSRGAHARANLGDMKASFCDETQRPPEWNLFQFELPKPQQNKHQAAPMNWALDVEACSFILNGAKDAGFNQSELGKIYARLTPGHGQEDPPNPPFHDYTAGSDPCSQK